MIPHKRICNRFKFDEQEQAVIRMFLLCRLSEAEMGLERVTRMMRIEPCEQHFNLMKYYEDCIAFTNYSISRLNQFHQLREERIEQRA